MTQAVVKHREDEGLGGDGEDPNNCDKGCHIVSREVDNLEGGGSKVLRKQLPDKFLALLYCSSLKLPRHDK